MLQRYMLLANVSYICYLYRFFWGWLLRWAKTAIVKADWHITCLAALLHYQKRYVDFDIMIIWGPRTITFGATTQQDGAKSLQQWKWRCMLLHKKVTSWTMPTRTCANLVPSLLFLALLVHAGFCMHILNKSTVSTLLVSFAYVSSLKATTKPSSLKVQYLDLVSTPSSYSGYQVVSTGCSMPGGGFVL
jgi:hypothetical protein